MDAEDTNDIGNGHHNEDEEGDSVEPSNILPSDLPRSLDDRQNYSSYHQETEYYDAWQGMYIIDLSTSTLPC